MDIKQVDNGVSCEVAIHVLHIHMQISAHIITSHYVLLRTYWIIICYCKSPINNLVSDSINTHYWQENLREASFFHNITFYYWSLSYIMKELLNYSRLVSFSVQQVLVSTEHSIPFARILDQFQFSLFVLFIIANYHY